MDQDGLMTSLIIFQTMNPTGKRKRKDATALVSVSGLISSLLILMTKYYGPLF